MNYSVIMKKITWLLFYMTTAMAAYNNNSTPNTVAKDTVQQHSTDTFHHNPAMPAAQNSDDPDRFSQ